ncbi:MAG: hypothetical protein QF560_13760, partial [SAR324 cluster bacterium]|nr:hypothetical protein [SAR324 cluster bacterium]HJO44206.1 hypothetical protein [SAR324 cluster bacterium]
QFCCILVQTTTKPEKLCLIESIFQILSIRQSLLKKQLPHDTFIPGNPALHLGLDRSCLQNLLREGSTTGF